MEDLSEPFSVREDFDLTEMGIDQNMMEEGRVNLQSDKFICIREVIEDDVPQIRIIDMNKTEELDQRIIFQEMAIVNPEKKILTVISSEKRVAIHDLENNIPFMEAKFSSRVIFIKWISATLLAIVTDKTVYHWKIPRDEDPIKIFDRDNFLNDAKIIDYDVEFKKTWMLLVARPPDSTSGLMQFFDMEKNSSKLIRGDLGYFIKWHIVTNQEYSRLICFCEVINGKTKLVIRELERHVRKDAFPLTVINIDHPVEAGKDSVKYMQISWLLHMIYLITERGFVHVIDYESGTIIFVTRLTSEDIVASIYDRRGGVMCVNSEGRVLSLVVHFRKIIPYVAKTFNDRKLTMRISENNCLPGVEDLFIEKFNDLFDNGRYLLAAQVAAVAPLEILRTPEIVQKFIRLPTVEGRSSFFLKYCKYVTSRYTLNEYESKQICVRELFRRPTPYLRRWMVGRKITCTEELGDMIRPYNLSIAGFCYARSKLPDKTIQCLAELGEVEGLITYARNCNYVPDYKKLLNTVTRNDPNHGELLARRFVSEEDQFLTPTEIIDVFMEIIRDLNATIMMNCLRIQ